MVTLITTNPTFEIASKINDVYEKREHAGVELVRYTLILGKYLRELKPHIPHGEWTQWVINNTSYTSIRTAQSDMKLFLVWQPYLDRLMFLNLDDSDATIDAMTFDDVSLVVSAMRRLAQGEISNTAFEIALSRLDELHHLDMTDANEAIDSALFIDSCGNLEKETAVQIAGYGLSPTLFPVINDMSNDYPEVIDEMKNTGHLYVPHLDNGEGRQIPLRDVTSDHINLVTGENSRQKYLSDQDENFSSGNGVQFNHVATLKGSKHEVLAQLAYLKEKILAVDNDLQVKVTLTVSV